MSDVIKEVAGIDEATICATIAYGYTNKREAAKAISEYTGEGINDILPHLERKRVMREEREGGVWFYWDDVCRVCKSPNRGAVSYVWQG
jgi:hypothetical protein